MKERLRISYSIYVYVVVYMLLCYCILNWLNVDFFVSHWQCEFIINKRVDKVNALKYTFVCVFCLPYILQYEALDMLDMHMRISCIQHMQSIWKQLNCVQLVCIQQRTTSDKANRKAAQYCKSCCCKSCLFKESVMVMQFSCHC